MQNQIDAAIAAVSAKISKGGAVTAVTGWAFDSQSAAMIGVAIAFLGFLMAQYFNIRRDRREQREHDARMKAHDARMKALS